MVPRTHRLEGAGGTRHDWVPGFVAGKSAIVYAAANPRKLVEESTLAGPHHITRHMPLIPSKIETGR